MPSRSFQTKLLVLVVGVLLLLQVATLVSVDLAGRRAIRNSTAEELRVGARVLNGSLATRARQLSDSLRVLALDFAFREAIASGDIPTITSVLANHGSRISADAVVLVGLDGVVIADTLQVTQAGRQFPFGALIDIADLKGEAAATVSFGGRPYQFVLVPVLAPRPIAWVVAGFPVDDRFLVDIGRLTSLNVSVWSTTDRGQPHLASNLNGEARSELIRHMAAVSASTPAESTLTLDGERYATLIETLKTDDNSRITAVLQRSLGQASLPFRQLQYRIITFSTLALFAALVAALIFSRTVSSPLKTLADAAQRVEQGDYQTWISLPQEDEIGQLATAFNQMQSAIATREEEIIHQATHDVLTGLPNRTLFLDRVALTILEAQQSGGIVGMIMMDVDRFKEINETLGHYVGDQLLIEIGRRLVRIIDGETVARLGGDEFAIKFTAASPASVDDITGRFASAFESPFLLGDLAIDVSASLGVAFWPTHAEDAETLMKRADVAMYDAKKSPAHVAIYEPGRDEHTLRRLALMTELRQAISRNELELRFQPKVEMRGDHALHAEALLRWNHGKHGVMPPDEFIPLAEQSGNISIITKWVLRNAIAQCADWGKAGLDVTVAINLSAVDLFDSELPIFISGLLSEAGVRASQLVLEITESAVMKDPNHARKILGDLKARGVTLAIDDFGTGYSSLAHLKRLPVDELKIDKSFVLNLTGAATNDLVIVRSTIELAHNMGLKVVAEGVETREAFELLRNMGCDLAQGYWMSKPLPAMEFAAWIAEEWKA